MIAGYLVWCGTMTIQSSLPILIVRSVWPAKIFELIWDGYSPEIFELIWDVYSPEIFELIWDVYSPEIFELIFNVSSRQCHPIGCVLSSYVYVYMCVCP